MAEIGSIAVPGDQRREGNLGGGEEGNPATTSLYKKAERKLRLEKSNMAGYIELKPIKKSPR